jgi:hypothetical protein
MYTSTAAFSIQGGGIDLSSLMLTADSMEVQTTEMQGLSNLQVCISMRTSPPPPPCLLLFISDRR